MADRQRRKKSRGPSKLTPEVRATILRFIRLGAFRQDAARAAGIHDNTLVLWLKRGDAGERPYAAFARAFRTARAQDAVRTAAIISRAAQTDWRAAAWLLEHHHAGYGARDPANADVLGAEHAEPGELSAEATAAPLRFYLPSDTGS